LKNCLFINFCDNFLLGFVHNLYERNIINLETVYTDKQKLSDILHPEINYIDVSNFYDLDSVFTLNFNAAIPLSKYDIEDFFFLESEFLSESDRLCFKPISVKKRKLIYYELLQYWINYFAKNSVDLVVFDGVPHMGWDLVCYEVARKFNVHTCYLELTVIEDQVIWHDDYKSFRKLTLNRSDNTLDQLKSLVGNDIYSKYLREGELLKLGKKLNDLKNKKSGTSIIRKIKTILYRVFNSFKNARKDLNHDSSFYYNKIKILDYIYYSVKNLFYLQTLNKKYSLCTIPVDLDRKYIFFAMHYQPERTTSPQGECFQEQILAIKIIASSLPNGWKLLIKEHPTQLLNRKVFKNKNFRSTYDYGLICKIKNVVIVPISFDSAELIKNAQLVATINGSVGWETLSTHFKPVVIFGNIWYANCRSCFSISSQNEFKDVLKELNTVTPEQVEKDVLELLLYYSKEFCNSSDGEFYASYSSLSNKKLIDNLANKFVEKYI